MTDARIIRFPSERRQPTCFTCQHYDTWSDGVGYCEMFDTDIDSEIFAAEDCPGYEPEPPS